MSDFLLKHDDGLNRCKWAGLDSLYVEYHDSEWGVAVTGDQEMFERITLEGFQAGLSWITILRRRENFRKAFHNFDFKKVSKFSETQVEKLMLDSGIIRNRAKIQSTISNAQLVLELQKQSQSISDIVWSFAPPKPKRTAPSSSFNWRATSEGSDALSKHLKKLGFGFVGSTTMYALMQATGLINDHAPGCFRRKELS
jgi:DNA-3-methyladenine glycosylase I